MIWQEFLLNTGRDYPFSRYNNMQREMSHMFSGAKPYFKSQDYPNINAWMDDNGAIITGKLPGIAADDIKISASNHTLTISGICKVVAGNSNKHKKHKKDKKQEIEYGTFSRTIRLSFQVDSNKINAKLHNGLLHIALEKLKEEKPEKMNLF